jgi:hypothetical protein
VLELDLEMGERPGSPSERRDQVPARPSPRRLANAEQ